MEDLSAKAFVQREDDTLIVELEITLNGLSLATFNLDEPEMFMASDYTDFAAHRRPDLTFTDSNGFVAMEWQNANLIKIEVGKMGEGGGTLTVRVPGSILEKPLRDIAEAL